MKFVYCLLWEESERGWGVRPDGASLHLSTEDSAQFVKAYWAQQPDEVPDEYSRPSGKPKLIEVDDETYEKIEASKNGIRIWQSDLKHFL